MVMLNLLTQRCSSAESSLAAIIYADGIERTHVIEIVGSRPLQSESSSGRGSLGRITSKTVDGFNKRAYCSVNIRKGSASSARNDGSLSRVIGIHLYYRGRGGPYSSMAGIKLRLQVTA